MKQPNVIVIYTDDQGTLDAGCYGSPDIETPAVDGLAARGIRFTQAYAHTVCCPSRAALLTGRYPQRCGVNDWCSNHTSDEKRTSMNRDEVTLASLLKDQGYSTGLMGNSTSHSRIWCRYDSSADEYFEKQLHCGSNHSRPN